MGDFPSILKKRFASIQKVIVLISGRVHFNLPGFVKSGGWLRRVPPNGFWMTLSSP